MQKKESVIDAAKDGSLAWKGVNVYLYYWTLPIFFLFFLINYFLRNIRIETLDISLMISVVSFLFGFLVTISFSMLITRVGSLKDTIAMETGRLVSLYLMSKQLGEKFHHRIRERIDSYTIKTLRYYENYEVGRDEVYGMYDDLAIMDVKTEHQKAVANSFVYVLGEFEAVREKLEYLTSRRTEWSLKFSTYLLGIILIVLLFLNRGDMFTNGLFIILSTIIVFLFLIIEDYDNLIIGDYSANISNSEQLFALIGEDRYYPQGVLSRVKLEPGRSYRVGVFDSKTKQEKVFRLYYNPSFKLRINALVHKFGKD
jgi:hypothetical protein